ncbi:hypothetical protein C1645_732440 [Glomus cerebriforme]|uniref:Uncharacterized protein n=1 Tax=Glomus cerebriforme TaxID=658196 RepID=A0A397THE7_9GLOM|nr:hypothetical protein C1645_732440 [Glomus cerebriforme]
MGKKIVQRQPYSYRHPKRGAESISLSDRFTLIKMQRRFSAIKNRPCQLVYRKSNRAAIQKTIPAVTNDAQISEGRSVFSRIGAVAKTSSFNQSRITIQNQEQINNRKKKKTKRTRFNHIKSKFLDYKLPIIHEEHGDFSNVKRKIENPYKMQGVKDIIPSNLQFDPVARKVAKLSPKKRKIVMDANDLDKELEEYMAAAPYVSSPKVKDELTDVIDFDDVDFMDMED